MHITSESALFKYVYIYAVLTPVLKLLSRYHTVEFTGCTDIQLKTNNKAEHRTIMYCTYNSVRDWCTCVHVRAQYVL